MKIKVISDLHVDASRFIIEYNGEDVLIVAGDICGDISYIKNIFLDYLKNAGESVKIIFVPGNHDYYGTSIYKRNNEFNCFGIPQLHVLNNSSVKIGGYLFVGSTLWSSVAVSEYDESFIEFAINDFVCINDFDVRGCRRLHNEAVKYLYTALDDEKTEREKTIVVTHFLPSEKSIAEKYKGSIVNKYFFSPLDSLVGKCKMWIHGHTHASFDYILNGTRVLCNPRGIVRGEECENPEFNPGLVVEID